MNSNGKRSTKSRDLILLVFVGLSTLIRAADEEKKEESQKKAADGEDLRVSENPKNFFSGENMNLQTSPPPLWHPYSQISVSDRESSAPDDASEDIDKVYQPEYFSFKKHLIGYLEDFHFDFENVIRLIETDLKGL
jgi:hypothetical protein